MSRNEGQDANQAPHEHAEPDSAGSSVVPAEESPSFARLFEGIASTTPDFLYVFDTAGRFLYANRRLLQVWGRELEDVVGKTCLELGYERWHHDMHMREIAEVITTRLSIKGVVPFTAPLTGTSGVYEYIFSPVIGASGEVEMIAGTTRDVSERAHAQAELSVARRRLDSALFAGEVGTFEWDIVHDRMWGDANFARLFGVELDGSGQLPLSTYLEAIHPDDREEVRRRIDHSLTRGAAYTAEYRIQHGDGSRWVVVRGKVERDGAGRPLRFPGVVLDVTERRRVEERLRLAQEVAAIGTFEWNVRNDLNSWSPELERLHGLRPGSFEGTFEAWTRIVHPDDVRLASARAAEALETGSLAGEWRVIRPDGSVRWMEARGQVFRDAAGKPERMIGVNLDVTERKALQVEREALLEAEQVARTRAEVESRLKDEFLTTLSHELRTPLSAILGWSQLLLRRSNVDEVKLQQGLSAIERNARTQARLIEDLLDVSRIVSGKVRLDVRRVSLAELVHAALATVQPPAEARGVRLEARLDPQLPALSGDPERLQQVVWNLLSNAVKFTPKDGKVEVRLERAAAHVQLTVTDTGEGIEPAFLPYVFDRFRQADGTTTRQHGGLGLGLSIVRHLVELHGGTVRAESAGKGQGARFTVWLPVERAIDRAQPDHSERSLGGELRSSTPVGPPDHDRVLDGVRVLLVDDDTDGRELVRRVLEERGAAVWEACSADRALEVLAQVHPTVLVSDIGMPGGDGYSLIRRVRALAQAAGRTIPAVALTALARPEDRERALAAGFDMHLAKPVILEELVSGVEALARDPRLPQS